MNARTGLLGALKPLTQSQQAEINAQWADAEFCDACRKIAAMEPRNHAQLVLLLESVERSIGGLEFSGMGPVMRFVEDAVGAADFVFAVERT